MKTKIIECVPNFSEGRNKEVCIKFYQLFTTNFLNFGSFGTNAQESCFQLYANSKIQIFISDYRELFFREISILS